MSPVSQPNERDDGLEVAVDQAIAVCEGDMRAAARVDRRKQSSGNRDRPAEQDCITRVCARALSDHVGTW